MGSNANYSLDGRPPVLYSYDLMSVPSTYTDVNVVPEHEKSGLEQSISNLEGEILQLRHKRRLLDERRREVLDKILNIKGSIRVFCRVRPSLLTDKRRVREIVSTGLEKIVVNSAGSKKEFRFDKVFAQDAIQEDVFVEVLPILKSALDGNNVCLLAYGQTGTGKTFTMDGTIDQPGIVPRALEELLHQASLDNSSVTFSMSMLEIYMGNLRDLLAPKPVCRAYDPVTRWNLNIQTDPKGFMEIEGLTELQIPDFAKARWWYTKGMRVRSTSLTNVNEASSRSHCLTRITIFRHGNVPGTKVEVSKLWMVDLGGSERLLKTGATGQTLDEGRAINLSLSALADVIAALRRKRGHVPYRNSKLTQILKDSLGDGSKVLMVVHVSPAEVDTGETICSLSFANRARGVESNKDLPEHLKKQLCNRIANLEEDLRKAEEECQTVRNQIKKVECQLTENKKLFSTTYHPLENAEKALGSPKRDFKEANGTPQSLERPIKRNLSKTMPRFMTSTAASRHRQETAEREIVGRATTLRTETRSSILFSASQSLSYSDARLKSILRSSDKKSRNAETNPIPTESPKYSGLELKTVSLPRSKIVALSDPKFRTPLRLHRRRMSNLI